MKKFITLFGMCLLALMLGCASPTTSSLSKSPEPVALSASAPTTRVMSAATLARAGTCEADVAASYTDLIISRQSAALALQRGKLAVQVAQRVQRLADQARADLDAACPDAQAKLNADRLRSAQAALADIATLLKVKP
jgi:hypothetical protein